MDLWREGSDNAVLRHVTVKKPSSGIGKRCPGPSQNRKQTSWEEWRWQDNTRASMVRISAATQREGKTSMEKRSDEEMERYLNGLKRYTEKGIPIYMDGKISGQREWERLFEVREDGMFYMGDYVQAESGGLKEIRFDKVYLSENDLAETRGSGRRRRSRK